MVVNWLHRCMKVGYAWVQSAHADATRPLAMDVTNMVIKAGGKRPHLQELPQHMHTVLAGHVHPS